MVCSEKKFYSNLKSEKFQRKNTNNKQIEIIGETLILILIIQGGKSFLKNINHILMKQNFLFLID